MQYRFSVFLILTTAAQLACTPAAAPVAVGNKPISVNGVPSKDAPAGPSAPLSEMSWANFDGNVSKLKDLKGKVVLLDFWATNCPPCIEEIPHLMELKLKYGDDLVLIGLHVGDAEDRQKVRPFAEKLKITYPLAYPDDALTRFIFANESAIPQTAVIDRNGNMIKKIVGFNSRIKSELDEAVGQAIGTKAAI
ncbi:MAG: TlpA family protein disulfide reductase [Pyrinomonadaceae bacterium]